MQNQTHFWTANTWLGYLSYVTHNHRNSERRPWLWPINYKNRWCLDYIWLLKGIIPSCITNLVLIRCNTLNIYYNFCTIIKSQHYSVSCEFLICSKSPYIMKLSEQNEEKKKTPKELPSRDRVVMWQNQEVWPLQYVSDFREMESRNRRWKCFSTYKKQQKHHVLYTNVP